MSSARHRLIEIIKRAKRLRNIDANACRNILATIREVIEAEKSKGTYTVTNLYCNWSLHNEISQSLTALRTLEAVSIRGFQLIRGQVTEDEFIQFFSRDALNPNALRTEIIHLCRKNNVKDFIFSNDLNWNIFLALILQDLIKKPIQFPEGADTAPNPSDSNFLKKTKKIYKKLSDSIQGERARIFRKTWVSLDIEPWDNLLEHSRQPVFHCNVECFDRVTFKIKMTNIQLLPVVDEYRLEV